MNFQKITNFYWWDFFSNKERLEILKNNSNYILTFEELNELLSKKSSIWNRNLSYRQNIRPTASKKSETVYNSYNNFKSKLEFKISNLTSLDYKSDLLYLWWNWNRIYEILLNDVIHEYDSEEDFSKLDKDKKQEIKIKKEKELENLKKEDDYILKQYIHTNYEKDKIKDYEHLLDIVNSEFVLLDLETTGFYNLHQIIEFGWRCYNREFRKTLERIEEVKKIKTKENFLSVVKFFNTDYLYYSDGYELLKSISNHIISKINNDYQISDIVKTEDFNDIVNKIDFWQSNINKETFISMILKMNVFYFKYSLQVHFYIKQYKDYVNKFNEWIHHISNDIIQTQWKTLEESCNAIYKFLNNQVVLAQNSDFDLLKISELFNDAKKKWPKIKNIYDTINIFTEWHKKLWIANLVTYNSLDYITKLYTGVDMKDATLSWTKDRHTAIYDVNLTKKMVDYVVNTNKEYDDAKDTETKEKIINRLLKNINKEKKEKKKTFIEKAEMSWQTTLF